MSGRILAIDAGTTHTRLAVASTESGSSADAYFDGACILRDRVGIDNAQSNIQSLLSRFDSQRFDFIAIGIAPQSINANSDIGSHVKSLLKNAPVFVVEDFKAAAWGFGDRSILLNGGAGAWAYITSSPLTGGRQGQFATIGSGEWIGQEFFRVAYRLLDEHEREARYLWDSITMDLIARRVVQTDEISTALAAYDSYTDASDPMWMRRGMIEQSLAEHHEEVREHINGDFDFSSLVPVCMAASTDGNLHARRILEDAGAGLARLVLAAIREASLDIEDDLSGPVGPVSLNLHWWGGVLSNCHAVRDTMIARLKKEAPKLQVDKWPIDPLLGLVRFAQRRASHQTRA